MRFKIFLSERGARKSRLVKCDADYARWLLSLGAVESIMELGQKQPIQGSVPAAAEPATNGASRLNAGRQRCEASRNNGYYRKEQPT